MNHPSLKPLIGVILGKTDKKDPRYTTDQLRPVEFEGFNIDMVKPKDWTPEDGDCGSLPVQRVEYHATEEMVANRQLQELPHPVLLSCWKASFWQRLKILFTGKVWLSLVGGQPPCSVHSDRFYGPPPGDEFFDAEQES